MLSLYVLTVTLMMPIAGATAYETTVETVPNLSLDQCLAKQEVKFAEANKKGQNAIVSCKLQTK